MDFSLFSLVRQGIRSLCQAVRQLLRRWTKPNNDAPVLNTALDLTRSRTELVLENALLRQQLIVLNRHTKRPALSWRDRALFVLLASMLRTWKQSLLIVRPDTVLRWHRELFRRIWHRFKAVNSSFTLFERRACSRERRHPLFSSENRFVTFYRPVRSGVAGKV